MSGQRPNKPDAANPAMTLWLAIEDQRSAVAELGRWRICMKRIICILFPIILCGCSSMPGSLSAQERLLRDHPNATILSMTRNDEYEPDNADRCFVDFGFLYRNVDGTEHEEVLHYKRSAHGWYLATTEQIR